MARKPQQKTNTTMEKGKLDDLTDDVPTLKGIITYTENITALKVFNVEILQQSTTGQFGSKETLLGCIKMMMTERHKQNSSSSFYYHPQNHRCRL